VDPNADLTLLRTLFINKQEETKYKQTRQRQTVQRVKLTPLLGVGRETQRNSHSLEGQDGATVWRPEARHSEG